MKKLIINVFVLSSSLLLFNCSDDDSTAAQPGTDIPFVNPEVAEVYKGTQSPGDVWTWALDKEQGHMTASWDYGTFDDESDDISIEGTFVTLPSGYLKVTITAAEPATAEIPTDGSAWFYALEIPNMVMVIKPEGSIKGDLIAMVAEGDCQAIEASYNYIISAPGNGENFNPVTEESFGYAEFTNNGNGFDVSGYKFSLDCINGGPCSDTGPITDLPVAICEEGGGLVISSNDGTVAQGQFTNAGAMMMDFGYGNGGVFATKTSEDATMESLVNKTFLGLAYLPQNNSDKTIPVKVDFYKNELDQVIGAGYPFADIENNTVESEEGAVILVDNIVNGRVYGRMNFDEDQEMSEMAAAYSINGDDEIFILTSYDEISGDPFILVLAKQN